MGVDVWLPRYVEENVVPALYLDFPAGDKARWDILQTEMAACQKCELSQSRKKVILGDGNQQADYFWVTEAPSEEDEKQGVAFSDHSSELLTEMLRAMGLSRDEIFITHIVKCRPSNDKDPRVKELEACASFLQRQIALVQPKIIIAVGRIAAQKLLSSKAPLSELRGQRHEFSGIPLFTFYHPAYLLRSLTEKQKAWQDMQQALTIFGKINNNVKTNIKSN